MTPEMDLILRLLVRNLELSAETQADATPYGRGYREGLGRAADEISRARDVLLGAVEPMDLTDAEATAFRKALGFDDD